MTDLTNVIDSTDRAAAIAHMLVRLAPEPMPEPPPSCVEPVLAAVLYAASPVATGRGIAWVYQLLTTPEGGTLAASVATAGAPADTRSLRHCDELAPRHRELVMATLRQAVRPWVPSTGAGGQRAMVETTGRAGRFR